MCAAAAGKVAHAQPYGLEERRTVGPFWNARLPEEQPQAGEFAVINAFPHLTFANPIGFVPGPGSHRLYVYTREGRIFYFESNAESRDKTLFLDISKRTQGWDDCGLLGMAFHPEFGKSGSPNRGFFFVSYQFSPSPTSGPERPPQATPGYNRLSRFTVPDGSEVADPESELVLINQFDESVWHNGGAIFFHPEDSFLYLSLGDEGGVGGQYGNAQRIDHDLFAGVIRIDVDQNASRSHPIRRQPQTGQTAHYFIPNDNPWLDSNGGVLEEFWCIGLREPHRMTLDPLTKTIWVGDVGQEGREEINIIERAANYQWAYREGGSVAAFPKPSPLIGIERPPLYDYPHLQGEHGAANDNCVIGGYIYRGGEHAAKLSGKYIFGDNGSGRIWSLTWQPGKEPQVRQIAQMPPGSNYQGLSGFSVDHARELYLCQMGENGRIYKLVEPPPPPDSPPTLLSQTGVFTDLANLTPAPGLIPYSVNSPLWSDGAVKFRWIAIPNDALPYAPDEQISVSPSGEWSFPSGTVFVKHFELPSDETNPKMRKRLETRLLVRDKHGAVYGVTYKWREDHSDADLLPGSLSETVRIRTDRGERTQTWYYPSRQDCLTCHTAIAGHVLGVRANQLNGLFHYAATGRQDNQLRVWAHIGLFNPPYDEAAISSLQRLAPVTDDSATLGDKVRSYLAANCAQCHRPGGVRANFDARYETPIEKQGLVGGPLLKSLGVPGAATVVPGDPDRSMLFLRINAVGENQMPPLARNLVDARAVQVVAHWIRSLPRVEGVAGLKAEYFNGRDGADLRLTRLDSSVNFAWGEAAPFAGLDRDSFSVRWTGQIEPLLSEEYTFSTLSDDGVRLWVDGQLIIDNWTGHAPRIDEGIITLAAGRKYNLRLDYFEAGGGAEIQLRWSSARQPLGVVPGRQLSTAPLSLPDFFPPYLTVEERKFRFNAEQVADYEVQVSTDLLNWEVLRRFENSRGALEWADSASTSAAHRFYRVLADP
jgi:uncharacterized repeat protein (TIGR03806 family)